MNFLKVLSVFILLVAYSKGSENQNDLQENEELTSPKEGIARKKELSHSKKRSVGPLQYSYNKLMKEYYQQVLRRLIQFPKGKARQRSIFMISKLTKNWKDISRPLAFRLKRTIALTAVRENIYALYNSPNNPTHSFVAVTKLIEALYNVTSKTGPITNKPALFLCSIISLFSEARLPKWYFRRVIFPGGINKTTLELQMNKVDRLNAEDAYYDFRRVKNYINAIGSNREKIPPRLVGILTRKVNKTAVHGWWFSGSLEESIEDVVNANNPIDTKLGFDLAEYYVKFSILRQLLLITAKSLVIPGHRSITFYDKAIRQVLDKDKLVLRFLYDPDVNSQLLPYFDGQYHPLVNTYLSIMLGISRPDKFPGLSCIGSLSNPTSNSWGALLFPNGSNPIFGMETKTKVTCRWRIVSHAQNLYSIVYKPGVPLCVWCGALLTIDERKFEKRRSTTLVGLSVFKPALWGIFNSKNRKNNFKIKIKRFCGANCNKYLHHLYWQKLTGNESSTGNVTRQFVGRLMGGYKAPHYARYWIISPATPSSDMTSKSGSADVGQLPETGENGETDETSVDEDENGIEENVTSETADKVSGNTIQA